MTKVKECQFDKWNKEIYDINPIYYVYQWYNIETGYIFYVGKGCKDRYRHVAKTKRNAYFINYINAHQCNVKIVKDSMSEKEAFDYEKWLIEELKKTGQCCCNFADGGGQCTVHLKGELNPMFGKTHSPEAIQKIREANLRRGHKGKNNNQYGISPSERMDEKTYKLWREKHKIAFAGSRNNKARKTIMKNIDGSVYKTFGCIKECAIYLSELFPELKTRKIDNLRRFPEVHCSPEHAYKGFYFEIIKPNKDNTVSSSEKSEKM